MKGRFVTPFCIGIHHKRGITADSRILAPCSLLLKKMKFFSSNKKPNLRNIAILSITTVIMLLVLHLFKTERQLIRANAVMMVYFALVSVLLFTAFKQQLRFNPYSYNTILFSGFGFFILFMVWNHLYMLIQSINAPGEYDLDLMMFTLLNSAKNYLLLTAPLLIVGSIALFASTIILVTKTKDYLFHNYFGLFLPVLVVGGLAVLVYLSYMRYKSGGHSLIGNLFLNLFSALYLYFECMLIGTIIADILCANYKAEPDKDFLIVLGCGLEKDGTPTPLLKKRLDAALNFAKKQSSKTGKEPSFVVSGGQGADEIQSEAASMRQYLLTQNVPEKRILTENRSTNTAENMLYSGNIIHQKMPEAVIAFVTTNFHVFRSGVKAVLANMKAVGIGAPTNWFYWPNAAVREFIGLIATNPKKQILVLLGLLAFYTLLTVLNEIY